MTTRAAAIIADAGREVLHDPLARYQRRKVRELHRLIEIDGTKLGRDGEAAVTLQIDRIEAEIYDESDAPEVFITLEELLSVLKL